MAASAQSNLLTIPGELRQMIWELVFPSLSYHGGADHHHKCPDAVAPEASANGAEAPSPCPCNDRQLQPLLSCIQTFNEMKQVVDKVGIDANYTGSRCVRLRSGLEQRVRSLTLDETVYPVISCRVGILEHVHFEDFVGLFPSLEKIVMPEDLGDGLGLSFPEHIPMHIESCLRKRGGPEEMPNADMTELVRSDLAGRGYDEHFALTESIVLGAGVEICSTYRYRISVSANLDWPLSEKLAELYDETFCGEILWSGKTETMVLKSIPDLRGEWWWEAYATSPEKRVAKEEDKIDWTEELGGWDLMDLLKKRDENRTVWLYVDEESHSFH